MLIQFLASNTMFPGEWPEPLPNEMQIVSTTSTLMNIYRFVYYEEERQALLDLGSHAFKVFLSGK
jgi:hypothetical protein